MPARQFGSYSPLPLCEPSETDSVTEYVLAMGGSSPPLFLFAVRLPEQKLWLNDRSC